MQTNSGLVARLDSLQHQINELTRRTGGGASDEIATVEVDTPTNNVVFDDLPQNYRHLRLIIAGGVSGAGITAVACRYNAVDSGYEMQLTEGSGNATSSQRFGNLGYVEVGVCGPSSNSRSNSSMVSETVIGDYTRGEHKYSTSRCSYLAGSGTLRNWSVAGLHWGTLEAVERIALFTVSGATFTTGTSMVLYGLR